MASLLRQIVAGPRSRHPEAGLDLCYVTDNIIATSGPSSTYPQRAYRNPTDALVKFLDYKHGKNWSIWEFRAEGTGYPDSEVYNRIRHYPWPDHHPPPFAMIPNIMASMREWLKDETEGKDRVAVVHCKAGKGRSGTVACSYLISEEGWTVEDALLRFTARRMRSGFGSGISIPSQRKWIEYVDWWTKHEKVYIERKIEIVEVHVWGLRDGVKVAVEGYVDEGRIIRTFHTFAKDEKMVMNDDFRLDHSSTSNTIAHTEKSLPLPESQNDSGSSAVLFRPSAPVILPTSDIKIDFERRNKATYGFTMVTSVAHVWFNCYFECQQYSKAGKKSDQEPSSNIFHSDPSAAKEVPSSGVFSIDWDGMDGIKGSARKGTRAFDRLSVVWRAAGDDGSGLPKIITEPETGQPVQETVPADWRKAHEDELSRDGRDLGLRADMPASAAISRAGSIKSIGKVSNAKPM